MKFGDFIHTKKRDPQTNLKSPTMMWDFWSLSPESLHQVTILFSESLRGLPPSTLSFRFAREREQMIATRVDKEKALTAISRLEKQREKLPAKIVERDERIAASRRRAEDDRTDVHKVGEELKDLYENPNELLKHARVVGLDEIEENEFNLNIPRYVDTFEPEPRLAVKDALAALTKAEDAADHARAELSRLLTEAGYAN